MSRYLPLFGTGTARTGAGLVCRMLSVNPEVMVASDPYLELFRSLRNAIVRTYGDSDLQQAFDPAAPFPDCYFSDAGIRLLDLMLAGDLTIPFDRAEWERLLEVSKPRTALECADLTESLPELLGPTYKALFDNGLAIIARERRAEGRKWVGIKEVWTIELFGLLARAYPEARFFVVTRDPRATTASMLAIERTHPEQVVHTLSWARHWRKYAALTLHYRQDQLLGDRIHVVRHEDLLRDPVAEATQLCEFLEVDFDPAMLDTSNYVDYATGGVWAGNSSFEEVTSGISEHRGERWRTHLAPEVLKVIEFVCGPEMRLLGYELVTESACEPDADVLDYLIENNAGAFNWRTDFRDPQLDYGFELFRRALLALPETPADTRLVRRSFLFEEVCRALGSVAV